MNCRNNWIRIELKTYSHCFIGKRVLKKGFLFFLWNEKWNQQNRKKEHNQIELNESKQAIKINRTQKSKLIEGNQKYCHRNLGLSNEINEEIIKGFQQHKHYIHDQLLCLNSIQFQMLISIVSSIDFVIRLLLFWHWLI